MADLVMVDTDVLIDAARDIADAVVCLEQIEQHATLAISTISEMELVIGCRNKAELRALDKFLARFQIIKLSDAISDMAIDLLRRYRLSHGLLIADALIAATALSQNISFVTRNERDYRFISGLRLLEYPQPFQD
jgi:predicted nucleic acid-binding protein